MNKTEIELTLNALRAKKESLCRSATSEIEKEISDAKSLLKSYESRERLKNESTLREIAKLLAEMSEKSFLIYVLSGFDNRFEVTNHVQWIEISEDDDDLSSKTRFRYLDYDAVTPEMESVLEAKKIIDEQYEKFVLTRER